VTTVPTEFAAWLNIPQNIDVYIDVSAGPSHLLVLDGGWLIINAKTFPWEMIGNLNHNDHCIDATNGSIYLICIPGLEFVYILKINSHYVWSFNCNIPVKLFKCRQTYCYYRNACLFSVV